jgi:hypothetical protein
MTWFNPCTCNFCLETVLETELLQSHRYLVLRQNIQTSQLTFILNNGRQVAVRALVVILRRLHITCLFINCDENMDYVNGFHIDHH